MFGVHILRAVCIVHLDISPPPPVRSTSQHQTLQESTRWGLHAPPLPANRRRRRSLAKAHTIPSRSPSLPPSMLPQSRSLPASSLQQALLPSFFACTGVSGLSPPRRFGLRGTKCSRVISLRRKLREALRPFNYRGGNLLLAPRALNSNADSVTGGFVKKRNVVEHIFLLKSKSDISEDEERNMLDYLYTSQYQMRGILAISLGRIVDTNMDGFTHAVFMRFQNKEDLEKFYGNSYYAGVLKEHVMPYCYDSISVDYESEVEDDILPIFRRGEEFNYGAEFVLLFSFSENALYDAVKDALTTFQTLMYEFNSLIIQATQGSNFNRGDGEYTHGAVIRFPSRVGAKANVRNVWWNVPEKAP
ncbi:hypothetical protein Taro_006846 [Colocasia esculenta]|uniref:Stress-response A/B barrel domain-containing protein n=1 Tax=Colocasia esculenta TaxID=4460 RepID=A0A843TY40_COLES|nr:hypothetical protein [Colocasia esculenta]